MGTEMDKVVATAMARAADDRYRSTLALITAARAARAWSGVDRRSPTRQPPGPLPAAPPAAPPPRRFAPPAAAPPAAPARPAAPAPPPPAPAPPAARPARPLAPVAAGVAALVGVGVVGVLLLMHRGGGGATPSPTAAPTVAPPAGLLAALLTIEDFARGSVAQVTSALTLDRVSCGAPPAEELEERRVAFVGRGDTTGRGYFNAAASFPSEKQARSYLDALATAAQSCTVRLPDGPAAPALGDGTVRVLFPSRPDAPEAQRFVFDALYIRRGRVVSLVMVSRAGTTAPPAGDAEAFGKLVVAHMATAGV